MTPQRTQRTKGILATRLPSERCRMTPDRHEIHLASSKLLPTTSLRLAIVKCELFAAVNRSRGEVRVSGRLPRVAPGIAINGNTAVRYTPASLARS